MNDHLHISEHGVRLVTSFEGKPRLRARLCEGGRWELGYGVTFWPNGRAVQPGETCDETQAKLMFAHALERFEKAVKKWVKVELSQFQFDALVSFAYNIGDDPEEGFPASTVLKRVNERRWEDAAEAFDIWLFATSKRPTDADLDSDSLAAIIGKDGNGPCWIDADGKPCAYRRALRGLLRRHLSEACLFMGWGWAEAAADGAVFLRKERTWNTQRGRWEDYVPADGKTEFAAIKDTAKKHPLPAPRPPEVVKTAAPQPPAKPAPAPAKPPLTGVPPPRPPAPKPAPVPAPAPKPPKELVNVDRFQVTQIRMDHVKPMEESDRFLGALIKGIGLVLKFYAQVGAIPMLPVAYYFEFFGDPYLSAYVMGGIHTCAHGCAQWLIRIGKNKRRKHLDTATTVLT